MEVKEDLADLLDTHMKRESVGDSRLASLVNSIADNPNFIHRSTIRNWRSGSSQKVSNWRQLVTVAAALHLNEEETNELLVCGGCPPLSNLSDTARESEHPLFNYWLSKPQQQSSQSEPTVTERDISQAPLTMAPTAITASPFEKPSLRNTYSWRTVAIGVVLIGVFFSAFRMYHYNTLASAPRNLLINSDFSKGNVEWVSYVNNAALAKFEVRNEIMRIHVDQSGSSNWHIQLFQQGLELSVNETYTVRFRVRGEETNSMKIDVTRTIDPKITLGFNESIRQTIPITNNWTIRTIEFVASQTTPMSDGGARVLFDLGKSKVGFIEIDDVEFFKGTLKPTS